MSDKISVGDIAPDFTLKDSANNDVNLKEILKEKSVVLYFYPKDNTPGCTAQACSFRDSYEDFKKAGAEVIGVSSDTEDSHEKFIQKNKLPFILLSDKNGELRKSYGVKTDLFGIIPGRVTYVIDKNSVVRYMFSSQMQTGKHIEKSLEIIKFINSEEKK